VVKTKFLLLHGYVEYDDDKNLIHNICRSDDGRRFDVVITDFEPYFYAECDTDHENVKRCELSDIPSYDNKQLYKIYTKHSGDVPSVRKEFKMHYEADIPFPMRFKYDKKIKAFFEIPGTTQIKSVDESRNEIHVSHNDITAIDHCHIEPVLWCVDIETWDVGGFVEAKDATEPIMSIAVKDESADKYACFVQYEGEIDKNKVLDIFEDFFGERLEQLTIIKEPNEESMLARYDDSLKKKMPDILYGWNFTNYDTEYIKNRMKKHRIKFDKDIINFDAQYAYQKLSENLLPSLKLDAIANDELDVGKLPRETIHEMYENNIEKLIAYNLGDVYLTSKINKKRNLIKFHLTMAQIAGTDLNSSIYNSMLADSMFLNLANGEMILPSSHIRKVLKPGKGGKVQQASTGIIDYVGGVDLNKAYPTAIERCNLSPETFLGYMCDVCKNDCKRKHVRIDKNDEDEVAGHHCEKFDPSEPIIKVPSGRCYMRDKVGIVPRAVRYIINKRKEFQAKEKEYLAKGDKVNEQIYFEMQFAAKKITNSMYGVMGQVDKSEEEFARAKFRLADGRIQRDITHIIRLLIYHIKCCIQNLKILKKYCKIAQEEEMLDKLIGYQDDIKVVAGDTDSVLYTVPFDKFDSRESCIEHMQLIEELLNRSSTDFAIEYTGIEGIYGIEFEKFYQHFFMGGKKKKYAGYYLWKKGYFMDDRPDKDRIEVRGYETRRSDWSALTKKFMDKTIELLLIHGVTEQEYGRLVRRWMKEFYAGEHDMDMRWPMGINSWTVEGDVDKNGKQKSITMQQRAAMKSNELFGTHFAEGSKPWLCLYRKLKNGESYDVVAMEPDDDPSDFGEIDYDAMWERNVRNPLERMVDTLGWKWEYLESGAKQGNQSEFW